MGKITIRHKINHSAIREMLSGPHRGVARDLLKRGHRVVNAAKRNLNKSPRRVDTGALRNSIHLTLLVIDGYPAVRIGSNLSYALFVHDGTGLFGPHRQLIVPKRAKALVFTGKSGKTVFAKHVVGMPPNPFLKDALPFAKY